MQNNLFDQIASEYDTKERQELAKIIVKEIKSELKNSKDKSLLDYGSGTGLVGLELSPLVDKILLMDSAEQMLEIAKEKIIRANMKNAEVIYSDFTKTTSSIKADIIVVSLVLLHIPDTNRILKQFFSVLKENGKLIIVDFDKNEKVNHPKVHNGFSHTDLKSLLTDAGFKKTEIRTFYNGENIFMNQDASLLISTSLK
ncbi:ribosomal protein L11 methyltransferase-like protein [Leptospira fainei serovar Hurstbridge str. BUT 6]|uniref:Ribosomal protein L11 methyltransferase-like protein n=1 Tax=Leptospira fainei serovar Hurstbridge str. BUT 6 TaxID=1193011 RepID=S3UW62_9LEPT|nr:class I SAM-dependent methyltransferase [Leptospira fainei]EPG72569.1 ribosomal protein L11 methyltransferase-like protein [Leptospira fainei serovar Hurstbridge str. BUT 6]